MSTPKVIGRYHITTELGRGGMATVYHAIDPRSKREVAIKVLPREMLHDATFRARFEREIKTLVGLEHPHIVTVYDVGDEDGQPYFVMRYMQGGSLGDRIKRGKIPLQETASIIEKIAKGLEYAHKKGLVHRDLKPDNILFDDENNPFISDFGIAKLAGGTTGNLTDKKAFGSPAYMSPEQAQGEKLDPRSDVYSLGVIIYQMLTGRLPYVAESDFGMAYKQVHEPVPNIHHTMPTLPLTVDKVIRTAMAKNRNERYASAIDLAKALNRIAFGNEGDFSAAGSTTRSSLGKAGFIIGGIILLVAVFGFFLLRDQLFAPIVPPSPTPTLTFTAAPTDAATHTAIPTDTPLPPTATATPTDTAIPYAPNCPASAVIPTPSYKELDKFCVEKIPYTTISIPAGATFQTLDPAFVCKIESTRNGRSSMSCTGKPAFSFNLKVCLPVNLLTDPNKCASGSVFDTINQCCLATPPQDAGCNIIKLDIRACPP